MTPLILTGLTWISALLSPPQPLAPMQLVPPGVLESQSVEINQPSSFVSELQKSWQAQRQLLASA